MEKSYLPDRTSGVGHALARTALSLALDNRASGLVYPCPITSGVHTDRCSPSEPTIVIPRGEAQVKQLPTVLAVSCSMLFPLLSKAVRAQLLCQGQHAVPEGFAAEPLVHRMGVRHRDTLGGGQSVVYLSKTSLNKT